jgi:hypothetical protein
MRPASPGKYCIEATSSIALFAFCNRSPFSNIVGDRYALHFNAGMSVFPNAHDNRHLTNYNVGARAIYAVSRDFNLMLEALAGWNEDIAEGVFAFEDGRTQDDCDHFS